MSANRQPRRPYQSYPQLSEEDFIKNPALIKTLYENAVRYGEAWQLHVDRIEVEKEELKEEITRLKHEIIHLQHEQDTNRGVSLVQPILILLGGVLSAFGVNIATTSPQNQAGLIMSISGYSLQLFTIFVPLLLSLAKKYITR